MTVLVSIIMPAFRAERTIARAARSVLAQTMPDWELIIVADDHADYARLLGGDDISDQRFRFISTGHSGSGCHNARNVGLRAAKGTFIAPLDADDLFLPHRLERLLPIARRDGAATDNPRIVDDTTGASLYRAFDDRVAEHRVDISALLALTVPLFPIVARTLAEPRLPGIELGEDVVANLRLIDRIGALTALSQSLSEYRVVTGSLSHSDTSGEGFEKSYSGMIERLEHGDRLGISNAGATQARAGLIAKRELNRAFTAARIHAPGLDFQNFVASRR